MNTSTNVPRVRNATQPSHPKTRKSGTIARELHQGNTGCHSATCNNSLGFLEQLEDMAKEQLQCNILSVIFHNLKKYDAHIIKHGIGIFKHWSWSVIAQTKENS